MTNDKKDESVAVNKARQADADRPDKDKDAVAAAANVHRDNVNPNAYSEESARDPGDITTYSINEPGPDDPQPFKVPEDHTITTPETLEQAYPDGYVAPEPVQEEKKTGKAALFGSTDDPDELEDEIDQAKEEGDFKSSGYKPTHKSSPTKRK